MDKPTVYVDTNIFSSLHYRGSNLGLLDNRRATRQWWDTERRFFELLASKLVRGELEAGCFAGQNKAVAEAKRVRSLPLSADVRRMAGLLRECQVVPDTEENDAGHLAFAIVYRVDYLLSWNRAHLVSEEAQARLSRFRAALGLRTPLVVSPESIMKVALGESIIRKD